MGIINFVKQGVQEMCIARPDAMKNLLVYKHPDETIPWKAFLTVAADECAVFFKDGRVQGVVQPGRVNLDSNNIPFLSNLIDKFTGGNVLKSWVFFITLKPIYDVPVGGALGMMEDPLLGEAVEPRFFGKIAVQIVRRFAHPKYGKMMNRKVRLHAHDESNEAHIGDTVEIMSSRPLSKTKHWRLVRIVAKGPGE